MVAGTILCTKKSSSGWEGAWKCRPSIREPTLCSSHRLIWPPATLSFPCHWAGSDKALVEEITDRCSGTNQRPRGRKAVRFSLIKLYYIPQKREREWEKNKTDHLTWEWEYGLGNFCLFPESIYKCNAIPISLLNEVLQIEKKIFYIFHLEE